MAKRCLKFAHQSLLFGYCNSRPHHNIVRFGPKVVQDLFEFFTMLRSLKIIIINNDAFVNNLHSCGFEVNYIARLYTFLWYPCSMWVHLWFCNIFWICHFGFSYRKNEYLFPLLPLISARNSDFYLKFPVLYCITENFSSKDVFSWQHCSLKCIFRNFFFLKSSYNYIQINSVLISTHKFWKCTFTRRFMHFWCIIIIIMTKIKHDVYCLIQKSSAINLFPIKMLKYILLSSTKMYFLNLWILFTVTFTPIKCIFFSLI